jgi:hypothetical protein
MVGEEVRLDPQPTTVRVGNPATGSQDTSREFLANAFRRFQDDNATLSEKLQDDNAELHEKIQDDNATLSEVKDNIRKENLELKELR